MNRCYWPDSEATGQLLTDLAEHLADSFDVHVVCGQPNSPVDDRYVRRGQEVRRGVTIHRLKHTTFRKGIPAGRLINLISFSRSADRYLRKTKLACDVIVSETDPFFLPAVGHRHAQRIGARSVAYLQDIYPDVAEAIGKAKPGPVTRRIRAKLRTAYQAADLVIVLGSCMRDRLIAPPWDLDPDSMAILPNWADTDSISPVAADQSRFRAAQGWGDRVVIMHSGNMGLTQNLDSFVRATGSPHWPSDAVLALVGDGASRDRLETIAAEVPQSRVQFFPYQPRESLGDSLSAADLHLVSMDARITGCLCPSKLYGIMSAGRPILAMAGIDTDLVRTINQHQIGWAHEPGDADAIARWVGAAVKQRGQWASMGQRARAVAVAQYDRRIVFEQFTQSLQLLVGRTSSSHEAAIKY